MLRPSRKLAIPTQRLRGEDGVTLIEVLMSILLVGLIALSFTGLDAVGRTTADQRRVSQATQIAQADQERMRGMSADQLATLNQTRNVTIDGQLYTVTSTGQYQSNTGNGASCTATAGAADFAKVVSSVNWANNKRSAVVEQSLITPRIGGALVVQAVNQGGIGIAGVPITATGTDTDTSGVTRTGTTDSGGCVIFGSLPVGTYSASGSMTGYVDANGNTSVSSSVTTTAGNTSNIRFTLGLAGQISATFKSPTATGQKAPSISWNNVGMATPGTISPASIATTIASATTQTLFPFTTSPGVYTGNYTVWAGRCATAKPPVAANQSLATVPPDGTATGLTNGQVVVLMPAMNVVVKYAGSNVKPAHIKLTDSCGQAWQADIKAAVGPATPSGGWLLLPGQPYGNTYSICADYDPPGTTPVRTRTLTDTTSANTNFTTPTTQTVAITSGSPSSNGLC